MIRTRWILVAALSFSTGVPELRAQDMPDLVVEWAEGVSDTISVETDRGFAAISVDVFEQLGWSHAEVDQVIALAGPADVTILLRVGSPFFQWNEEALQLADAPYRSQGGTRIPLQLFSDFLPRRLPELYDFDAPLQTLQAADPADWDGEALTPVLVPVEADPLDEVRLSDDTAGAVEPSGRITEDATNAGESSTVASGYSGVRVVVIDAGHGGGDPGTLGLAGLREKNIALSISLIMADLLSREPGIEVHLTRDDDTFVPIWDRGQDATDLKGDRPGVFISVHANSFPDRRSARGFETYFLSEARNEHERRVSAIENAPLSVQGHSVDADADPDLGFILRELRSLDHQHWSAMLAEFVQSEMGRFHPGPDRGVKQGVLAVLTNAVMPSVLVEVGYLSNADEAPLLGDPDFQDEAARAIARAVVRFFERYPPGAGAGGAGA